MRASLIAVLAWSLGTAWTLPVLGQEAETSPSPTVTPGWKKQVVAGLNLNQGAFENWQKGGSNFLSWQAGLNAVLEKDNASINWSNKAKLEYGLTYVDGEGTRKSADTLELETVHAWKAWPKLHPFAALSAKTQFDAGFDHSSDPAVQTSAFMDPGYFTQSAGLKWVPAPEFNTRLGFAVKETVTDRFSDLYGIDPGTGVPQKVLVEPGASSVSELALKVGKDSQFTSKLDLFWNGRGLDRTVAEWDNLLAVKLGSVFSLQFSFDLRYDPAVFEGWQIKETLGIGISYTLL